MVTLLIKRCLKSLWDQQWVLEFLHWYNKSGRRGYGRGLWREKFTVEDVLHAEGTIKVNLVFYLNAC